MKAAVFRFDEGLKVYLYREPIDFRVGINGLSILVEQAMRLNPMVSALFVFGNRRRRRPRKMNTLPPSGFSSSAVCTFAASP